MTDSEGRGAPDTLTKADGALAELQRLAERRCFLVVHDHSTVRTVALGPGEQVLIGRDKKAKVQIQEPTVSRQHARIGWGEDDLWIEDLGSSNGTRVNGQRIHGRARLKAGDEVSVGSAALWLHATAPSRDVVHGLEDHDELLRGLEAEVLRARSFGRTVALIAVGALEKSEESFLGRSCPRIRDVIRPVDRIALYAREAVEILVLEAEDALVRRITREIVAKREEGEPALGCGIAIWPEHAASVEQLIEAAHGARLAADRTNPIRWAKNRSGPVVVSAVEEGPVAVAAPTRELLEQVDLFAGAESPVLIVGETGAGKEVVAREIHRRGPRKNRPLVAVNCGGLSDTLVLSTLFGHEQGAFTGADASRRGLFEAADRGILFLDEVGELSAAAQAALLRVLETKRVRRVGGTREVEVDVRVLAATHRDLEAMGDAEGFRRDLYFRLSTIVLHVPPLRERPEDILPLARRFLVQAAAATGAETEEIAEDAAALLVEYEWPGNVRELRNVILHAALNARGRAIRGQHLGQRVRVHDDEPATGTSTSLTTLASGGDVQFRERVQSFERQLIVSALRETGWNRTRAAKLLGMPIRTLTHKIRTLDLRPGDEE